MIDSDRTLTDEERKLVDESYENQTKGKLTSLSEFKKENSTWHNRLDFY